MPTSPRQTQVGLSAAAGRSSSLAPLAFGVALIATLLQATDAPVWRADLATLSAEESGALTGEFFPALAHSLAILPLGSQTLRSALLGAVASGICATILAILIQTLLGRHDAGRRMDPWLALAGACCTVFSFPFVTDATIAGGGATPAATLALALLAWILGVNPFGPPKARPGGPQTPTEGAVVGLLWGLLLSESPWCAAALGLLAASQWERPRRLRPWLALGLGGSLVAGVLLGSRALRLTEGEFRALRFLPDGASFPSVAPLEYLDQVGFIWAFGVGAAVFLAGRELRLVLGGLGLFVFDLCVPAAASSSWLGVVEATPARGALHLLALCGLAILGAFGLRRLADLCTSLGLLAAQKSAALLTLLALGAAVASIEDASRLLSQTEAAGPAAWTTAALHPLPSEAIVLTHSPAVSRRLRAAQKQGERPDILIVPLDSLAQAGHLRAWLEREPALKQLIVDMSVDGTPSEHALSLLSDRRAIFIEPDSTWDRRLLAHLTPTVPLARFSPHAIGRSDRIRSIEDSRAELSRVFHATEQGLYPDHATRRVLASALAETQQILMTIGDGKSQQALSAAVPPLLADLALLPRAEPRGAPAAAPDTPPGPALVTR